MNIGYYYYYYHGLTPLVPNKYVSTYHLYLIYISFGSWMLIFVVASKSSPGKITKQNINRYLHRYPPDGIIYK